VLAAGLVAGATVAAGVAAAGVAGFAVALLVFAAPPHAIPRALTPRTVERTIAFVILVRLLYFSQSNMLVAKRSIDQTRSFLLWPLSFQSKRENSNRRSFCQLKINKKSHFF